ncbi:hypothetical protein JKP88DRAFT_251034 [Tribonema minus]|uniref:Uncharacterized protein n=1 Tax=Tribonema minus TaxID=303371 RepID=A0A835ZJ79_9STRA|nr:hypothetical protein JKP88DRAFT_251034 [Tribonema minus]
MASVLLETAATFSAPFNDLFCWSAFFPICLDYLQEQLTLALQEPEHIDANAICKPCSEKFLRRLGHVRSLMDYRNVATANGAVPLLHQLLWEEPLCVNMNGDLKEAAAVREVLVKGFVTMEQDTTSSCAARGGIRSSSGATVLCRNGGTPRSAAAPTPPPRSAAAAAGSRSSTGVAALCRDSAARIPVRVVHNAAVLGSCGCAAVTFRCGSSNGIAALCLRERPENSAPAAAADQSTAWRVRSS